ncbi:BglG family transcription antiterminator [Alkalicella caledoniensis]|uniref:BglG family transcription antiterminator n=1 Tax=Alkalicella caledoniensis TaxID=2731377 RepID=A0A7G9WAT7_ALKCA|nr:BglG family transcription antiterminator [Alkalicella caledoniensis]QNO15799.1 BglG family transcription antiterminator [Alkalicella caledoniensis]
MISSRQKTILEQLVQQQDFFTVDQLAIKHEVSNRTIRNDILNLELFLKDNGIEITRHRKNGLKIEISDEKWQEIQTTLQENFVYLSPENRFKVIAKTLLKKSEMNFEDLMEEFKISDKTLIADLAELKPWFKRNSLDIVRERGKVIVKGRELAKRQAYLQLIKEETTGEKILDYILNDKSKIMNILQWKEWFQPKEINFLFEVVLEIEDALAIGFTDDGYVALILHMYLSTERLKKEFFVSMDDKTLNELLKSKEFQTVEKIVKMRVEPHFNIKLPPSEIGYITQHVLTAQRSYERDKEDEECLELAKQIVIEVEKVFSKPLLANNQIINNLAMHLKPAIYRFKYNKKIFNPLFEELKKEYGPLLKIIKEKTDELLHEKGISFDEHEISYIAMHIGAGLRHNKSTPIQHNKRIAIACSSGIGTANILKRKLQDMYPNINIVKKCSYKDLKDLTRDNVDIVISTIDIFYNLSIPWLKVSPLLTSEDEQRIINALGNPEKNIDMEYDVIHSVNEIIKIVEEHGKINNRLELSKKLLGFFKGSPRNQLTSHYSKGIEEILTEDSIILQQSLPSSVENMIRIGTTPLAKRGLIGLEYEEKLIKMIKKPNHHFMITNGVIFPHASNETGVWGTGMSLVTFQKPVKFTEVDRPLWLMITLAAEDGEKHVDALAQLIDALNDEEFISMLSICNNPKQIINWFQKREGSLQ